MLWVAHSSRNASYIICYFCINYFYLLTLQHAIQIDKTTSVSTIAGDDSTNDLMGTGTT